MLSVLFQEVFKDGVAGVDGLNGATIVAVSPDGLQVFVASQEAVALAVFDRDPTTCKLTSRETLAGSPALAYLTSASWVTVSPDGQQVFVASQTDNALVVLDRDAATGNLTFRQGIEGISGIFGAFAVAVSPDNQQVLLTAYDDAVLTVFDRDPTTGDLVLRESFPNDVDGIPDSIEPFSVATSADGRQVFVANNSDSALRVYDRNATTGQLTPTGTFQDNLGRVDGLAGAIDVAVSPDDRQVFVTGNDESALAVFDRDASTGQLVFRQTFKDGVGGVDGLNGAASVTVSPDNRHVFVASQFDDASAIFARDPATGALSFEGTLQNGASGLISLTGVAVTPDSSQVLVTQESFSNALGIFRIGELTPNAEIGVNNIGASLRVFEGAASDRYELSLGTQPAVDVTIELSSTDLQTEPQSLTFTPENWNVPQTVAVVVPDDTEVTGDRTATLSHAIVTNDLGFDSIVIPDLSVEIVDDDTAIAASEAQRDITLTASDFRLLSGGNDRVYASNEDDNLIGLGGNDVLFGRDGGDRLYGGAGNDVLSGDGSPDSLLGAAVRDDDTDVLYGGAGDDFLFGGGSRDVLFGQRGGDRLEGGDGDDILSGGVGNDELFGGGGDDLLYGGDGDDIFVLGADLGQDTITGLSLLSDRINLIGGLTADRLQFLDLDGAAAIFDTLAGATLAVVPNITSANLSQVTVF